MASVLIDMAARWRSVLGYLPVATIQTIPPMPINQLSFYGTPDVIDNAKLLTNGSASFEDFQLDNIANNISLQFNAKAITKSGDLGNTFAPPPMISWRKSKRNIVTQVDDTGGEVVERYSDGSWEVKLQGLIVDMQNHQFPLEKLEQLRKAFEVPDSFEVSGEIWQALGISDIYFDDVEIAGLAGFSDTVTYSLTAKSIIPVQFYLNGE